MPTVTERDTTVVSLTCKAIHDMDADEQHGESYTKLSNVTVKTSDGNKQGLPQQLFRLLRKPNEPSLLRSDRGGCWRQ
jgi:hypothetical protein